MATAPSIGRAVPDPAGIALAPADATHALYERYARQIFAYCFVQLRNREEAEDAVQTTFLNAFRGLERGVVPELESAWLYKIAHHVCQTRKRSWSRRRQVESTDDFAVVQEAHGAPAHDGEDLTGLTDALRELPEQQRRAILLREWQGLSYREIADEMQVSQAAVETLIFRARRGLAAALERLRTTSDMGSIAAAVKSIFFGGGAKVAAALVTVATTSVVAATPEARHGVAQLVSAVAPPAAPAKPHRVAPAPKEHATVAAAAAAAALAPAVQAKKKAPPPHDARPPLTAATHPAVAVAPASSREEAPAQVDTGAPGASGDTATPKNQHVAPVAPTPIPAGVVPAATTPTQSAPATTAAAAPKGGR